MANRDRESPPAATFRVLWSELSDLIGTAATATLLRRALKRAVAHSPVLAQLVITRDGLEYRFATPSSWNETSPAAAESLCVLTRELQPVLEELTGTVALRRLATIPALRSCGLRFPEDEG